MCEARRSTRHGVASGDTRIGLSIPPSMSKPLWHDGQFTYRLTLRLGKGRIPSPPRSMEKHPPVEVISK